MTETVFSSLCYLLLAPLVLKTVALVLMFRWKKHRVRLIMSVILAGAPMLLSIIPVSHPHMVALLVGLGIALAVLAKYTEVPLIPGGDTHYLLASRLFRGF